MTPSIKTARSRRERRRGINFFTRNLLSKANKNEQREYNEKGVEN